MKIKNKNPLGDVAVAALGGKLVARGADVDVTAVIGEENAAAVAALLLVQVENWEAADAEAKAVANAAIPAHLAELEVASIPEPLRLGDQPEAAARDAGTVPAEPEPTPEPAEAPEGEIRKGARA